MVDFALPEHYHLLAIFHQPLLAHIHAACQYLVLEVFLHLGDIDDVPLRKFLKLPVVDIRTVHGNDFAMLEMAGRKHEGIICGGGGEPDVPMNSLVFVNDGMHFYATLLLSRLGMTTHALENETYSSFCRMESSLTTDIHWCSQQFKRFRDISTFEIVQ